MKNKNIIYAIIIAIIIIATSITLVILTSNLNKIENSNSKTIPAPTLAKLFVNNNENISTYSTISNPESWEYTDNNITTALFTPIHEQLKNFEAITVNSTDTVYLSLDSKYIGDNYVITSCSLKVIFPDEKNLVTLETSEIETSDNKINIPLTQKGTNYYALTIEFERGTVTYLFKLDVK